MSVVGAAGSTAGGGDPDNPRLRSTTLPLLRLRLELRIRGVHSCRLSGLDAVGGHGSDPIFRARRWHRFPAASAASESPSGRLAIRTAVFSWRLLIPASSAAPRWEIGPAPAPFSFGLPTPLLKTFNNSPARRTARPWMRRAMSIELVIVRLAGVHGHGPPLSRVVLLAGGRLHWPVRGAVGAREAGRRLVANVPEMGYPIERATKATGEEAEGRSAQTNTTSTSHEHAEYSSSAAGRQSRTRRTTLVTLSR